MPEHAHTGIDIRKLLDVVRTMVGEVHPHWKNLHFTPDTHLERDLGLDSMARMELRTRIETQFGVSLQESVAIAATTPNDLLRALQRASGETGAEDIAPGNPALQNNASDLLMGPFATAEQTGEIWRSKQPTAGDWLFALYAWPLFIVLGTITWILVVFGPFETWRQKFAHLGARALFLLTFTPFRVTGKEHLAHNRAQIIVANHSSYLDGFIITAALDIPIHFIVKGELARNLPARLLLQRFGVEFVDRFNAGKGISDVGRIARKSRDGQSIVFFPEGTFTSFPGLQPFRMGAFVTAARSRVAIVPVAIQGARDILRGSHWFPYRGRISVTISPPIAPVGEGWQVALNLRDAARSEIRSHCGEIDLTED
ncbi:MAG: 1-acyl-sn-glycerol-3-phosphate acyltransferase [Gammaproteobacteria bacterium]|jgi:1-acyl-sn-glycerol-3-phosphate acyltransferase